MANFETILFDLGGTLYSYSSIRGAVREVIREAAGRLGSNEVET